MMPSSKRLWAKLREKVVWVALRCWIAEAADAQDEVRTQKKTGREEPCDCNSHSSAFRPFVFPSWMGRSGRKLNCRTWNTKPPKTPPAQTDWLLPGASPSGLVS